MSHLWRQFWWNRQRISYVSLKWLLTHISQRLPTAALWGSYQIRLLSHHLPRRRMQYQGADDWAQNTGVQGNDRQNVKQDFYEFCGKGQRGSKVSNAGLRRYSHYSTKWSKFHVPSLPKVLLREVQVAKAWWVVVWDDMWAICRLIEDGRARWALQEIYLTRQYVDFVMWWNQKQKIFL